VQREGQPLQVVLVSWKKKEQEGTVFSKNEKRFFVSPVLQGLVTPAHETRKAKGSGRGISTSGLHSLQGQLREGTGAASANPMLGAVQPFWEGLLHHRRLLSQR